MKRGLLVALVLVCSSVLLTACSNEPTAAPEAAPTSYADYDRVFADWAPAYVECAREFGAAAQQTDDGGIANPVAAGRPVEDGLDAECIDRIGPPPSAPPLTPAFLRGYYRLLVEQADCLREHGYTISEPPSEDSWVESYDGYSWNPLLDVNAQGKDPGTADGLCPQPDPLEAERLGADQE